MKIEPKIKKRNWVFALMLFILSGTGYLYVGRPGRYLIYLLFLALLWIPFFHGVNGWMSNPTIYLGYIGLGIAILIGLACDVIRLARNQGEYQLRWYNRGWVYLALILAGVAVTFISDLNSVKTAMAVRTFSVPSRSNLPAVRVGDYFTADSRAYVSGGPERGDVVVFRLPRNENVDYVKRVIGLPGDKIQVVEGAVFINDVAIQREQIEDFPVDRNEEARQYRETLPNGRSYLTLDLVEDGMLDNTQIYIVPTDNYFVLGDNRDNSADSRLLDRVGYIPRENIFARAGGIIYSNDLKRIGTKLN